ARLGVGPRHREEPQGPVARVEPRTNLERRGLGRADVAHDRVGRGPRVGRDLARAGAVQHEDIRVAYAWAAERRERVAPTLRQVDLPRFGLAAVHLVAPKLPRRLVALPLQLGLEGLDARRG